MFPSPNFLTVWIETSGQKPYSKNYNTLSFLGEIFFLKGNWGDFHFVSYPAFEMVRNGDFLYNADDNDNDDQNDDNDKDNNNKDDHN